MRFRPISWPSLIQGESRPPSGVILHESGMTMGFGVFKCFRPILRLLPGCDARSSFSSSVPAMLQVVNGLGQAGRYTFWCDWVNSVSSMFTLGGLESGMLLVKQLLGSRAALFLRLPLVSFLDLEAVTHSVGAATGK